MISRRLCYTVIITKSSIYTVKNMSVPAAEFAIWKIIVAVRMYPPLKK
jgi:hypothetical protein